MQAVQKETREKNRTPTSPASPNDPLSFHIISQYNGIPVEMKGSLERGIRLEPITDRRRVNDHPRTDPLLSGNTAQITPGASCASEDYTRISSSHISSLEISAYSKKTIPLIRHILTSALSIEMERHMPHYKISLVFSVFSSKRYLQGVVEGINELFQAISIPAKYYLEEKTETAIDGSSTSQTVIWNSNGEKIHSVWASQFTP